MNLSWIIVNKMLEIMEFLCPGGWKYTILRMLDGILIGLLEISHQLWKHNQIYPCHFYHEIFPLPAHE